MLNALTVCGIRTGKNAKYDELSELWSSEKWYYCVSGIFCASRTVFGQKIVRCEVFFHILNGTEKGRNVFVGELGV